MVLLFMQSKWISRILPSLGLIEDMVDFPILINDPFGWESSLRMHGRNPRL